MLARRASCSAGTACRADYHRHVPIYEFECASCGERFEALAEIGAEGVECRACGATETRRLLSSPAPPMHLVRTPRQARKQETRNAQLRERTKADFKAKRRQARERKAGGE
jgi:putative FmdB family regulatory protein